MEKLPFLKDQKEPISALLPEETVSQCPRFLREGMEFRAAATEIAFHAHQVFLVGCNQMMEAGDEHRCKELQVPCPLHDQSSTFRSQLVQLFVDEHQWNDRSGK